MVVSWKPDALQLLHQVSSFYSFIIHWTNRGSVGRLEPPYLELPCTHRLCLTPPEVCQSPNSYQNKLLPQWGGVLSSLFSWLITALHHHPRPALPLSLWLCCKLSVRWPAPSVFHGAGPETMGQNNPTPSICDETGCCHGSMNEIEWGNLAFCFLEKYGGR